MRPECWGPASCGRALMWPGSVLGNIVHATALADLSDVDRSVLMAMAQTDGPSRTGDLARAINRDSKYLSLYRDRLIKAGLVKPVGHGRPDFAMPYLREYLRERTG